MPSSIGEVLAQCMEPTEPHTTILVVCRALAGHKLRSQPVIRELARQCGRKDIRFQLVANCYRITWGDVNSPEGCLLASADMIDPVVDPDYILENNPDKFKHLRQRNAVRKNAVNNPDDKVLLAVEQRLLDYKRLTVELAKAFAFGGDLFADKETIQEAYGLKFDQLTQFPF